MSNLVGVGEEARFARPPRGSVGNRLYNGTAVDHSQVLSAVFTLEVPKILSPFVLLLLYHTK